MSGEDGSAPDDTMRERVPTSGAKFRILLSTDRRVVAAGFLVAVFGGIVLAGVAHPTPAETVLAQGDPLETLFQAIVGATVTSVTLVVTLSQLVLSQEQGPVGDQRERMEGAMSFRKDAESLLSVGVSPANPAGFLEALVEATSDRAAALEDAATPAGGDAADDVASFVADLQDNADAVASDLSGARFGTFDVLLAALNYNYSWKLYAARRLRADHEAELPEEALDALDDLVETLVLFGPAREHFKTLYFQWELTDLSRTVLYSSLPTVVVSTSALLFLTPGAVPGSTLGMPDVLLLTALAVSVSLLPFAVLLAYVLRILTVTRRTLSIGPFVLRDTDRGTDTSGEE